ncbi:MAG: mevalonate kinase [Candidatus Verstraetearchaeota archaeon]|nr:mevalonate kinase [Candidatus Verstraetearchaeota archaeon]
MKVKFSSPGKITLFGEHAIVYGRPAIVSAINKRVYVSMEKRDDDFIKIISDLSSDFISINEISNYKGSLIYIIKAIEILSKYTGRKKGVNIIINSEMPISAGLGTSAAVSIATIAAYSRIIDYNISISEIAKLGHKVELEVQGIASIMDTTISTFGGTMYIKPNVTIEKIKIDYEIPFILGYIKREYNTAYMVNKVKSLMNENKEIIEKIMETIGLIVEEGKKAILEKNIEKIGLLMNINHGLLDSLGVSNKELNDMVYLARKAGALGAKLTGAGGGGCIIALCPNNESIKNNICNAIESIGGKVIPILLSEEGLKEED